MIKVLIVDDSAIVRKILTEQLSSYPDIKVIDTAVDPYVARDKIINLKPDVVTLDIEMPRMDGLTFLAKLMKFYPIPVVIVSSLTPKNSEAAIKALELGAIDVIHKPGSTFSVSSDPRILVRAIRNAASADIKKYNREEIASANKGEVVLRAINATHKILAIGASTGGTVAIESLLKELPADAPGTVIVQHMPEYFTTSFAERLNSLSRMEVREAKDNDIVAPGVALIAPGNYHMLLEESGSKYFVKIKKGPQVHYQRPSVDVLFHSVAMNAGRNAIGVILTGMGADGAKGLFAMRENGAYTVAQDEKTCIVFGMPKEAINLGAVMKILPLNEIVNDIVKHLTVK